MSTLLFKAGKTSYSIIDERGNKSTITIEKWEADLLQDRIHDVHNWLQDMFNRVCQRYEYLSRREKGNQVRKIAHFEAAKHPRYKDLISNL